MADISKINLSGAVYNIKDATARANLNEIQNISDAEIDEITDFVLESLPSSYVYGYETTAAMQADLDLQKNMIVHTNGFTTSGDGNAAYYIISNSGTVNGSTILALQNGLKAIQISENSSITTAKIVDRAVTTTKIADDAITADKIASSAVDGLRIMTTTQPGVAKVGAGLAMNNGAIELDGGDIAPAVTSWLNAHPEATTTVEDGAVTDAKLAQTGGVLSEVHDIRTGADGTTYASAGDAVRAKLNIAEWQNIVGETTKGKLIFTKDGSESNGSDYECSDYIAVTSGDLLRVTFVSGGTPNDNNLTGIAGYDSNKNYVVALADVYICLRWQSGARKLMEDYLLTIPDGVSYIRGCSAYKTSVSYPTSPLVIDRWYEQSYERVQTDLAAKADKTGTYSTLTAGGTTPDSVTDAMLAPTLRMVKDMMNFALSDFDVHRVETSSTTESVNGTRLRIVAYVSGPFSFKAQCTAGSGLMVSLYTTEGKAIYGGDDYKKRWTTTYTTDNIVGKSDMGGYVSIFEKKLDNSVISDQDKADMLAATTVTINREKAALLEDAGSDEYVQKVGLANGTVVNPANDRAVCGTTYVSVYPGNVVKILTNKPFKAAGNYYTYGWQTYDENMNPVRGQNYDSSKTSNVVDIQDGERYFRPVIAEYNSSHSGIAIRVDDFAGYWLKVSAKYGYPSRRIGELIDSMDSLNVVSLNEDMDSAVVAATGYNTFLSGSASSSTARKKNLSLAVITDLHGSRGAFERFSEYVNGRKNYLDFALCLGDSAASNPSSNVSWLDPIEENFDIPFFYTCGNHDVSDTGSSSISEATARERFFSVIEEKEWLTSTDFMDNNRCSWFKDFSDYGVRVVSLFEYGNSVTTASGSPGAYCRRWLDSDLLQWFADTLYDTPIGYSVLVLLHQVPNNQVAYEEGKFTVSQGLRLSTPHFLNTVEGNPVEEVVNAFMTSTAISKTYQSIASYSLDKTATVNKDFSDRSENGSFICYLVGHAHTSYVLNSARYSDQKTIVVNTGSSSFYQRQYSDVMYDSESRNADSFVVVGIDTEAKMINLVQIGGQVTKDMRARDFDSISYE